MSWVVVAVVALVVLGFLRIRAARARSRMSMQPAVLQAQARLPLQTSQLYQTANSMQAAQSTAPAAPSSAWYQPGAPGLQQPNPAAGYVAPASETAEPEDPGARATTQPARPERYQGSTALSGTSLSSTLFTPYQPSSLITSTSSSLSGAPSRRATSAAFKGIEVIPLPDEVADRVRFHLRNGNEVEAVRMVCDTMDVGLLVATKTVRSYA